MAADFVRAHLVLINSATLIIVLKTLWTSELCSVLSSTASPFVDGITNGNPTHVWTVGQYEFDHWLGWRGGLTGG